MLEFIPERTQDQEILTQLSFVPGLKEILLLRQVHALEHATVWVLSQSQNPSLRRDNQLLGGMSTDQGFYLYGQIRRHELESAVYEAQERLIKGEWDLAIHPRCGTNVSVGVLLTAGLGMGLSLILPRSPLMQLLGLGVAVTVANQLTPDVGSVTQRYITTAIPFNLRIVNIGQTLDFWRRSAYFVRVVWQE